MEGRVNKFEDLEVWKEGMSLATKIYKELKDCHDFGLRDQMQRSAVSIPSNISEGYERNTKKDFRPTCSRLRVSPLMFRVENSNIYRNKYRFIQC